MGDMAQLIQVMKGAFQAAVAGVQVPVTLVGPMGLSLEHLCGLEGVEFRDWLSRRPMLG